MELFFSVLDCLYLHNFVLCSPQDYLNSYPSGRFFQPSWSVVSLSLRGKSSNAFLSALGLGLAVPQEYPGMLVEQKGFIHSVSPNLGCWFAVQWTETNPCTLSIQEPLPMRPQRHMGGHEPREGAREAAPPRPSSCCKYKNKKCFRDLVCSLFPRQFHLTPVLRPL